MADSKPTPIHSIQHTKFARQDGWVLYDISLCSSGNIAVSGGRYNDRRTFVYIYSTVDNSDSRDKPTLLYEKEFEKYSNYWYDRYISFIKPNSTEIVTCVDDNVTVLDYNRDVVLRSCKVNGNTTCLSVSESQIFIGLLWSDIVNIYDNDLNRIKSIKLKEMRRDWPRDISAVADRLYVRTASDGRAIVYSQTRGSILTEYTSTVQDHVMALSITVNVQLCVVAVLWNQRQVAVYSFTNNNCLVVFDVESVTMIRISDQGRIVTGNWSTGEVEIYDLRKFFTVENLSVILARLMSSEEVKELRKHFYISDKELQECSDKDVKERENAKQLMKILKEKGIFHPNKANELKSLFGKLGCLPASNLLVQIHWYQKNGNKYADVLQQQQPTVNAGSSENLFSISLSHEIPGRRFPKQENWQSFSVVNVFSETKNGSIYHTKSGKRKEILTCLFQLPSSNSNDNPKLIFSKVLKRQGYKELFLTFFDETKFVMCYHKTLEIIDINSKEVVKGHELKASARSMTLEEGEIFLVVGDTGEVIVFNSNLKEIKTLPLKLQKWKHPADMMVTSDTLFIICNVSLSQHYSRYNWEVRAMAFRREDGEMTARYIIPIKGYEPVSISPHKDSEIVVVLWSRMNQYKLSLHTVSGGCIFHLDAEYSHKIKMLNESTLVTINKSHGLKYYNMAYCYTITALANSLSYLITWNDLMNLQLYYGIHDEELNNKDFDSQQGVDMTTVQRKFANLFKILEERKLVGPNNVDGLLEAVGKARTAVLWSPVEAYLEFSDDIMSHEHMWLPSTSTSSLGKWPIKRQLGETDFDLEDEAAAKRSKMKWNPKLRRKDRNEALLDVPQGGVVSAEEGTSITDVTQPIKSDPEVAAGESEEKQQLITSVLGTIRDTVGYSVTQGRQQQTGSETLGSITQAVSDTAVKFEPVCDETHQREMEEIQVQGCQSLLETAATITTAGGVLEIPNTGAFLVIPPHALPKEIKQCRICMRIISRRIINEQVTSFSSNSSTVVELLPDSLMFQHPVRLSLPHCLVLQESVQRKARIFISHHRKESSPKWEEHYHLPYLLEDTACIIMLDRFCWLKYAINDEIVMARKVIVYTAVKTMMPQDEVAEVAVGYYPDLPEAKEDLHDNPNLIIVHKKAFFFVKRDEEYPLRVTLDSDFLNGWLLRFSDSHSQEIPYVQMASRFGCSFSYILEKTTGMTGYPLCVFTVSQENGQIAVQLSAHLQVMDKDQKQERITGEQFGPSLKAERTFFKAGGKLEIPGTGVVLQIPADSLGVDHCKVNMRIIPRRKLEDQVTSFCTSSTTAVEIFPSNLILNQPAKLSLPHCLMFKENKDRKARIFTNHEEGGSLHWKEQTHMSYKVEDDACIIQLDKLHCVKYSIDDEIVSAKIIRVYTAAKKVEKRDEFAEVEVGYYPDSPGGGELLRINPTLHVDSRKKLLFMDEKKLPLQLSLKDIAPMKWACCFPEKKLQDIPFKLIASSIEHSHLYILEKKKKKKKEELGSVICVFTASQMGLMPTTISLTVRPKEDQPKGTVQIESMQANADAMTFTFQYLSRELTSEWMDVGRALGLTDSKLKQIQADNLNKTKETIYQMFRHWKQANGAGATYNTLISALVEAERQDLAEKVQQWEESSEDP